MNQTTKQISQKQERWFAEVGIITALIASSCCVFPVILVSLGISGAWIGNLTTLEPYKMYFLGVTVLLIAAEYWHVYIKPKKYCNNDFYCARPTFNVFTKSALWIATALALLSATVNFWAPLFY